MHHGLVEPSRLHLRVLAHDARIRAPGRGHAERDELVGRGTSIERCGPRPEERVEVILRIGAADGGRELGVSRPCRRTEVRDERTPLLVGLDAEREPLLEALSRVHPLRRGERRAIAHPRHRSAVRGVLDHGLRAHVQRGLDHGRLDENTSIRLLALRERDEHRERAVHAGVRIAWAPRDQRRILGIAGDRCHGHLLHGLREADPLAPGPAEPERRHPCVHDVRVDRTHRRLVEAPVLHDARGKVLGDHVGPLHQLDAKRASFGLRDVERYAELVGVGRREHVAPLPPLLVPEHVTRHAHAIGMRRALDVDHLGPHEREEVRR